MASSIINSDDGSVSGTQGLKTTGGDDGSLKIQNNGVDAITISAAEFAPLDVKATIPAEAAAEA